MVATDAVSTQQDPKEGRMDTESIPQQDKQITVDVPEARVPEFYAWYARFLAGERRHRRGPRGRHCGPHGHDERERGTAESTPERPRHDG